jgi:hypothetical protein
MAERVLEGGRTFVGRRVVLGTPGGSIQPYSKTPIAYTPIQMATANANRRNGRNSEDFLGVVNMALLLFRRPVPPAALSGDSPFIVSLD